MSSLQFSCTFDGWPSHVPGGVISAVRSQCIGADGRWETRVSPGFEELSGLASRAGNHPSMRASGAIASFGSTRGHSLGLGPWANAVGQVCEWMLPLKPLRPGERRVAERSTSSHLLSDLAMHRAGWRFISLGRTPPEFSTSPVLWRPTCAPRSIWRDLVWCLECTAGRRPRGRRWAWHGSLWWLRS